MSGTPEMEALFRWLSLQYRSRYLYIARLDKPRYLDQSAYYKDNRDEFRLLADRYGEPLRRAYVVPSSVRFVDDSLGRGLFAEKEIAEGELIGAYYGVVQRASPCRPVKDRLGGFATDYAWTYPVKQRFSPLEVNARINGNELRFVNHSFHPNCQMEHTLIDGEWVLFMIALKHIEMDSQLTVDYGEEYWCGGHRTLTII